eukprot:m51a1_g8491 hypothetical protein (490) ;mRNA; r:573637-575335
MGAAVIEERNLRVRLVQVVQLRDSAAAAAAALVAAFPQSAQQQQQRAHRAGLLVLDADRLAEELGGRVDPGKAATVGAVAVVATAPSPPPRAIPPASAAAAPARPCRFVSSVHMRCQGLADIAAVQHGDIVALTAGGFRALARQVARARAGAAARALRAAAGAPQPGSDDSDDSDDAEAGGEQEGIGLDGLEHISHGDLDVLGCIADGAASVVRRCRWHGREAALKSLCSPGDRSVQRALRAEALLAAAVSACPHIVEFLGVVVVGPEPSESEPAAAAAAARACHDGELPSGLLFELMEGGSLYERLHPRYDGAAPRRQRQQQAQLRRQVHGSLDAGRVASDLAAAVLYLHEHDVVHGDIKSPNALLRDPGGRRDGWTTRWCAPEVLRGRDAGTAPSRASDAYSFGVVLWELATCRFPFYPAADDLPLPRSPLSDGSLEARIVGGETLSLAEPGVAHSGWGALIARCLHRDPRRRPTFRDIVLALGAVA